VSLTALIIGRDVLLISAGFYIRYESLEPPVREYILTYVICKMTTVAKLLSCCVCVPQNLYVSVPVSARIYSHSTYVRQVIWWLVIMISSSRRFDISLRLFEVFDR
jgi:hypothetical protein